MTTLVLAAALAIVSAETDPVVHLHTEGNQLSSGVVIDFAPRGNTYRYRILTCAHGKTLDEAVTVRFNKVADMTGGRVVAINKSYDLAVVEIERSQGCRAVQILGVSEDVPAADTKVKVVGFGATKGHIVRRERETKVVGVHKFDNWNHALLRTSAETISGDSGGPVLVGGKLAGITVANAKIQAGDKDGFAVTHHEIHKFLEEAKIQIPNK